MSVKIKQISQFRVHGQKIDSAHFLSRARLYDRPFVSKLLHDIRAVFSHVYDHFLTNAHIYAPKQYLKGYYKVN